MISYTVEILPYNIRSKGLSFEVAWDGSESCHTPQLTFTVNAVLGQYTNPLALEALQWRFYFVYTAL
jgi:hypothetical protein